MKKVLFVFVAVISMLTMTSCVDKEQCVGKWESENVSEEGFTGNFYLDLNEKNRSRRGRRYGYEDRNYCKDRWKMGRVYGIY